MIHFKNLSGITQLAVSSITRKYAVNGEKSLTGIIYEGDDVLDNIDKGWTLQFEDETYVITYFEHNDLDNSVSFDAVHHFFWKFNKTAFNEEWNGSHTFKVYLDALFKDTGYTYADNTQTAAFEKQNWGMSNRMSLFNDIIKEANVEFEINGTLISIFSQVGTDHSTIVRYGFNLSDMTIENDGTGLTTYGEGFGAYANPDDHDSERVHAVYESSLMKVYGKLEADPVNDERYTSEKSLQAAIKEKVDSSVKLSVKLSLYDLKQAGYAYDMAEVGDWITAIDEKIKFKQKIRIIDIQDQFDINGNRVSYTVTCGNLSTSDEYEHNSANMSSDMNKAADDAAKAAASADAAQKSADGKNTIYYVDDISKLPVPANEGDIGFVKQGDGQAMYVYIKLDDGTYKWEKRLDPDVADEIDKSVDDAINEAKEYADSLNKTTNDNFNKTITNVNNELDGIQPKIDQAKQEAIADADTKISSIQVSVDSITSAVNDPDTGLASTRVQLNNAIQQEIKDRKTGDSNTLTQAKDFTTSQIKSYDSGIQTQLTQTANGIVASVNSINLIIDSSLINKIEQWEPISQNGNVGEKHFYYSTGISHYGVQSVGYDQTKVNGLYSFLSSQRIYKTSFSANIVYVSVDANVKTIGGTANDYFIVYLHEFDKDNKFLVRTSITGTLNKADNVWHNYRKKITLNKATTSIMLTYQMRGNGNLYVARPYVGVNELLAGSYTPGSESTNSTILQLFKDNFALGIKDNAGAIISGINGDKSGTVISGKKIVLDGTVTVKDDFYAKGGNFKNLNASNMTAGTLNAAKVNLINLDASSITSGKISGIDVNVNKTLTVATGGLITWASNSTYHAFSEDIKYWDGTPGRTPWVTVTEKGTVKMNTTGNIRLEGILTAPKSSGPGNMWNLTEGGTITGTNTVNGLVAIGAGGIRVETYDTKDTKLTNVAEFLNLTSSSLSMGIAERTPAIVLNTDGDMISRRLVLSHDLTDARKRLYINFFENNADGPQRFVLEDYASSPPTTSAAANVHMAASGAFYITSSARRYKTDICYQNDTELGYSLMYMKPTTWLDKQELSTEKAYWKGDSEEHAISRRHIGLIAENLLQAGLEEYVDVDQKTGKVQSIYYDRLFIALLPALADMNRRLVNQEVKNG